MISLPWPALSGAGPKTGYGAVLFIRTEKDFPVPAYLDAFNDVIVMDDSQLTGTLNLPANITQLAYDDSQKREHGTLALNLLHSHQATRDLPFLCTNLSAFGSDLWSGLCASQQLSGSAGGTGIFCLGALPEGLERLDAYCRHESFNTLDELFEAIDAPPAFIILNRCSPDDISRIRYGKLSSSSPVLIVKDSFTEEEVQAIEEFPSVLICNSGICTSDEFLSRLVGIFAGEQHDPGTRAHAAHAHNLAGAVEYAVAVEQGTAIGSETQAVVFEHPLQRRKQRLAVGIALRFE